MRLLFVGDVFGKPGRKAVHELLPELIDRHRVDVTIVNVENAAGGFGITPEIVNELSELPIDCMTTGNHVWDKRQGVAILDDVDHLLRPANYPAGTPGKGYTIVESAAGESLAVINLEGQVFMKPLRSPFEVADQILEEIGDRAKVILVDFHAEATSEKQAMAFHLDGRVTAVVGTHTHVPTADARVLRGGTALQTDVGMTGPYDSIIGCRADRVLRRFLTQTPVSFEVAKRDVRLAACLIEADRDGRATSAEGLLVPLEG